MHTTWSQVRQPPEFGVTGERHSVKILCTIELRRTRFHYRQDTTFKASTYLAFPEQLARHYRSRGAARRRIRNGKSRRIRQDTCGEFCRED